MKKRLLSGLSALTLAALLAACAPEAPAPVQTTPPPETSPAQTEGQAAGDSFLALPVTEESIRAFYGQEGYEVRKLTPYEGDFLVEYGYANDPDTSMLDWVFGATGRWAQLTALDSFVSYEINSTGQVERATTGVSAVTPFKGLPETYTVRVLGDQNGMIDANAEWAEIRTYSETTWVDPAEPLYLGYWEDGGPAESERYEQLYDARIDADGLSFSFIPSGDSMERFQSFFPAATGVPSLDTSFDPDTRRFTLRLYNTSLESGTTGSALNGDLEAMGYPENLYPYSFPAGSLGRDSHFLTDVTIQEEGEDVVVSAVLTDRAYRFTVEYSNLGYDNIPTFRVVFREKDPDIDGRD